MIFMWKYFNDFVLNCSDCPWLRVTWKVIGNSEHELSASQGARVFIVDAVWSLADAVAEIGVGLG